MGGQCYTAANPRPIHSRSEYDMLKWTVLHARVRKRGEPMVAHEGSALWHTWLRRRQDFWRRRAFFWAGPPVPPSEQDPLFPDHHESVAVCMGPVSVRPSRQYMQVPG